ncbi:hypothetical protein Q4Q94_17295 [Morganella morganii]|uniref:hypothetical protein n=1 Tax=Morganella morganii TaxID=582 RepID=UPI0019674E4E|nr:hypothetical protein [Morganella morganii]ELA7730785.1 hypothetical protein [Morganella morganii]QSB75813.1 hypothetical protein JW294_15810 [Morganella morganii]
MECQLCSKELADDEVYVCDQCASECPHLEVVEKMRDCTNALIKAAPVMFENMPSVEMQGKRRE